MKAKSTPARGRPPAELPLPFSGFLELLKRRGFAGGVDRHLRLVSLLERIGDCQPQELKQLIAPLFATDEKEQAQFYRLFDDYFALLRPPLQPEKTKPVDPTRIPGEGQVKRKTRRIVSWVAGIVALGAIITFLGPSLSKKSGEEKPQSTPTVSPIPTTPTPTPERTQGATPPPVTATPSQVAVEQRQPPQDEVMPILMRNRTALMWIGGLLPLFLFGADEWRRFAKRRQLVLERTRGAKPPFTWPIRIEPRALAYLRSEQFYKVVRKLRRRQIAEYHRLDVARTIDATIAASGYPTFQYRPDSRMPEYLILIDRVSARDHQTALFDQFAQALQREGIFVTRYFFDGDPRVCWSERATASVSLGDLQKTFSEHRVILFGRGERLIDPVSGELAEWSHMFLEWQDRAVVTPAAPSGWIQREKTLAEQFLVFPATLEGIEQLAEHFDSSVPAELEVSEAEDPLPPDLERKPDIRKLRTYLGEPVFQWLCACAIYPELHWDLTLLFGSLPEMGEHLVTERNLLRLVRLPWFRAGAIPDEQRLQLLAALDPEKEQAVRSAIVRTLERSPAPAGSFAAEGRRLEIVVQEALLDRRSRSELKAALASRPFDEVTRDYVFLHETRRISPLVFALPEKIRSLFFERGIAGLALNRLTRLGLTSALALALVTIAFLVPEQKTTAVVIGITQYLESPLENAASDARKFEAALRNGSGLLEKESSFLYDRAARSDTTRAALGRAFQERSRPTDRVFYFAGHGGNIGGEQSLMIYPVDSLYNQGGVPLTSADLMEFVEPALIRGDRVFLFIDTAYAGAAAFSVNELVLKLPSAKGSIFAFFSAGGNEVSADSSEASNGSSPFTFFLLRGWQGAADTNNNGAITLLELMDYVRENVLAATNNAQRPLFAGHARTEMILPPLFGPKIYQGAQLPVRPTATPQETYSATPRPTPPLPEPQVTASVPSNVQRPAPPSNVRIIPDNNLAAPTPTVSPDRYQPPDQSTPTTAAPYSPAQTTPPPAYPTPTPSPAEDLGGIDVESKGAVPDRAQTALAQALRKEGLEVRTWGLYGSGPPNRVVVKYYFPEDASKAEKIRRTLSRVLIKMDVEIPKQLGPAQSYRPGHIDIWLPQSAVDLLGKIRMPASAQ